MKRDLVPRKNSSPFSLPLSPEGAKNRTGEPLWGVEGGQRGVDDEKDTGERAIWY